MRAQITSSRLLLPIIITLFSGLVTHAAKYLNLSTLKVEDKITTAEPTRTVKTTKYESDFSDSTVELDVSDLPAGTYTVAVLHENGITNSQKLIIK